MQMRRLTSVEECRALLKSCKSLQKGKDAHVQLLGCGWLTGRDGLYLSNLLVEMYGRCGSVHDAYGVFCSMDSKNAFSWRLMLHACLSNNDMTASLSILDSMPSPDAISCTAVLWAYMRTPGINLDQVFYLFNALPLRDIVSWNCMLAGSACAEDAEECFGRMPGANLVSCNSMLALYGREGNTRGAQEFFCSMPCRDVVSWTTMLSLAGTASETFARLPMRNLVSWNAMLSVYAHQGYTQEAISFFKDAMPARDVVSWTTLLATCDLVMKRKIFARMPCHDVVSSTTLVVDADLQLEQARDVLDAMPVQDLTAWNAVLGRVFYLDDAWRVFDAIPVKNVVSWNTLLAACSTHGEAEAISARMPQWNLVSWNTLLAVYARDGEVCKSKMIHDSMPNRNVQSWSSMVEVYILAGHINDAECILGRMPEHNVVSCTSLMCAYARVGLVQQASNLFNGMCYKDLVSWNTMLAGRCHAGELKLARLLFERMASRDLVSWTAAIAAYAQNGHLLPALDLLWEMLLQGIQATEGSFQCLLFACSHIGDVSAGYRCFCSMVSDHGITPTKEHYCCMVDTLARAGHLEQAYSLTASMPFLPDVEWTSLNIHNR